MEMKYTDSSLLSNVHIENVIKKEDNGEGAKQTKCPFVLFVFTI